MLALLAETAGVGMAGTERGHCVVCGRCVVTGHRLQLSDKFTGYQHLQVFPDAVLCPPCHEMLNNPQWRRSHWLMTQDGVSWLTRTQIADVVSAPPTPPFALYTTATFKKHGWLVLQQGVNENTHEFRWAWDERLFVERRHTLVEALQFVQQLLDAGVKRTELLGVWSLQHVSQHEQAYRQWRELKRLPYWPWVVWIAKPSPQADVSRLPL